LDRRRQLGGQYAICLGRTNELIFFSDSTTFNTVGARNITTNVPATLSMNTLTLNGRGASSGASSSTITIGSSASTWTIGDGTTSVVNLNANQGATTAAGWNYNIAANLTLNQANTLFTGNGTAGVHTNATDAGFVFSGSIGEAAAGYGITKSGSSLLTLSGSSLSFTGGITINGGILRIGNNTATQLSSGNYAGNISIASGSTLQLRSTSAQEFSGIISGSGGIQKAYGGTLTLSGNNTYTGKTQFLPVTTAGFTVNVSSFNSVVGGTANSSLGAPTTVANGTIDLGSGAAQAGVNLTYVSTATGETTDRVINVNFNGTSSQTITANNASGVLRFTSAFTSNAGTQTGSLILRGTGQGQIDLGLPQLGTGGLNKNDTGTWTLGGSGNFTGPTVITAGTLSLSSATALQNSPFNTASVAGGASAGLKIATTTLSLGGLTGSNSFESRFNTTSSVLYSGLTALAFNTAANATLAYSGGLADNGNSMTLTKNGNGTQYLTGTVAYTGATTVNAGFLGSNSTFSGPVTVTNGGGLAPGASAGAFGTFTISNAGASALTLNGGNLLMDISTAANDLIAVTGTTVLNGTNTVLPNMTTGVDNGTYTLATYGATTGSGSVVFANGSTTLGNATLSINAGNIQMTVAGGALNNSVWTGTSGTWDSGTNWNRNGTASQAFVASDWVTIDDTATSTTITSAAPVLPASVTVNNTSKAFTISASIGGSTPVVKLGSNNLTLSGTNSYSGGTFIGGGRVTITANANLGDAAGGITFNGGELYMNNDFSSARTVTLNAVSGNQILFQGNTDWTNSGAFTGDGGITLRQNPNGSTSATLTSTSNDFKGALGIQSNNGAMTVKIRSLADSALANGNIVFGANTQNQIFEWDSAGPLNNALTLNNRSIEFAGNGNATGVVRNSHTTGAITINTNLVNTGTDTKTLTLEAVNGPTNVFDGDIANGSGTVAVTKAGTAGVWVLSGNNSYTGATTISSGTLVGIGANAFGSTSGISLTGTNTLSLRGDSSTTFASSNVTTTASGATINVDQATIAGTGAKTMTIGTLGTSSVAATYQVNFSGSNNTGLSVGAVTGSASTAVATVTLSNQIASTGELTLASYTSANTSGGETLILTGAGTGNLTGAITPSATVLGLQKSGNGTWALSGSSSYTGTTVVTAGTLLASSIGNVGAGNTALGNPSNATSGIIRLGNDTNTGTLVYTGGTTSTDRQIQINQNANTATGSGVVRNNGSGTLTFTNSTFNTTYTNTNTPTRTLTLGGSNNGVIQGTIQNHSATSKLALIKEDAGTWTISGANSYTGATTVNGGTLTLNGGSQSSAITVQNTGKLGFDISSPTTSTAAVTLGPSYGGIQVTGTPIAASYTLLTTTATISGTPVLSPSIPGYTLIVDDLDTTLKLVSTGSPVGYAAWQAANTTSGTRDQDHDNDGVDNGTEHFLGGTGNTTGFTALPAVANNAGTLSVTWTKSASYTGAYSTDFVVETSATLAGPWTPETGGNVTITGNDVKYTFPGGPAYTGKNFARLRVTGP
jgi:autotransporter-associated beta strand protein